MKNLIVAAAIISLAGSPILAQEAKNTGEKVDATVLPLTSTSGNNNKKAGAIAGGVVIVCALLCPESNNVTPTTPSSPSSPSS
jgi:hypothetical protein